MTKLATASAGVLIFASASWAVDQDLVKAANEGLARAVTYLTEEVAYGGGYLGSYLADLGKVL